MTDDEWASLAIVLCKHFDSISPLDRMGMAHCKRALGLLERVAMGAEG